MKFKIIGSIIIILCLLGVTGYLFYTAVGHTDETSWGSWYQEYQIAYMDGTTAPLSLYHSGKSVNGVEYLLKANVNADTGSAMIDYNQYHVDVMVNNQVVETKEFTGSQTVSYSDGETQLVYASFSLDGLRSLSNGTYAVHFIPRGTLLVDEVEETLPSQASVMIRVGSIPSNDPPDDPSDDEEKDISFETDVIWS